MATLSSIIKCLVVTTVVGGGVTGAVLGATASNNSNEFEIAGKVVQNNGQSNYSGSQLEQKSGLSLNLSSREESIQTESSREADSISQLTVQPKSGEEKIEKPSDLGVKSAEVQAKEPDPKLPIEKAPTSRENVGLSTEEQNIPIAKKPEKEVTPSHQGGNLSKPSLRPRHPARRPRPSRPRPSVQADATEQLTVVKGEDWSKKNWFLVKWHVGEEFDASSWSFNECSPKITGEKVVFECPWNFDKEKMIELHLSISLDPELEGKRWQDVTELEFTATDSKNSATLAVTFSDDSLVNLILDRKVD